MMYSDEPPMATTEAIRTVAAIQRHIQRHMLTDVLIPAEGPLSPVVEWMVDQTADFLRSAVLERSAGGWGNPDLDSDFAILGDPVAFPADLLFAAIVQASDAFDVMTRVSAAVRGNYGLSRGALSFVARCFEEALLDGDEVGHPDFAAAFTVHQRFVDTDLRERFTTAAAGGYYD